MEYSDYYRPRKFSVTLHGLSEDFILTLSMK